MFFGENEMSAACDALRGRTRTRMSRVVNGARLPSRSRPLPRSVAAMAASDERAARLREVRAAIARAARDSGRDPAMWVAMAKLAISEAAVATALDAAHIFGGRGYLRNYGIEVAIRDTAPATTFSGTSVGQW